MKIHIDIRHDISPTIAVECIKQVIAQGKLSANGRSYCYATTFDTNEGEVWVAVRPYRKSDCFLVYKNMEEQQGNYSCESDDSKSYLSFPVYVLTEQKPAWSEEDELVLKQLIYVCHQNGWTTVEEWLKSLKPNHWKPSEEQMEALDTTIHISNFGLDTERLTMLGSLYNDLKKL